MELDLTATRLCFYIEFNIEIKFPALLNRLKELLVLTVSEEKEL